VAPWGGWTIKINITTDFNQLGHYASSPGNKKSRLLLQNSPLIPNSGRNRQQPSQ